MSLESRRTAGILFLVLPTVMYGGVSILMLLGVGLIRKPPMLRA